MANKRQKKQDREIDQHVGARVKQIRMLRNLSQTELGDQVGITFQQIQKCENGSNRIGSSRLWQFSQILDVPVSYFFEGLEGKPAKPQRKDRHALAMEQPETIKLVRNYYAIKDDEVRETAYVLIDKLAKSK